MSTRSKAESLISQVIPVNPDYKIDGDVQGVFFQLCDLADELADEFDAEREPEVLVTLEQVHGMVCVDIVMLSLEGELFKRFLELTRKMSGVRFSSIDGMLRVQLGVKDLWVAK